MADIDLTGTAAVATYLQKSATDTAQNSLIGTLITRASRSILNYTGREFAPGTTAARTFWYRGGEWMSLAPYDLRSAGTVTIDTETSSPGTITENTDFFLEPLPSPFGVYEHFRFGPGMSASTPRQVTVNGAWGFGTVPDDVAHACVVTVALWMRREVQAFSTTFSIDEGRLERPEGLPAAVRSMLSHYRRPGVV